MVCLDLESDAFFRGDIGLLLLSLGGGLLQPLLFLKILLDMLYLLSALLANFLADVNVSEGSNLESDAEADLVTLLLLLLHC